MKLNAQHDSIIRAAICFMFDPNTFTSAPVTGEVSTQVIPCPAGIEFPAMITEVKARQVQGSKDPSKTYTFLDIVWDVTNDQTKQATGRDKVLVRQSMILDITESGTLDMGKGKNVGLGRLRTALNQADAGQPWAPSMLVQKGAKIKVKHRIEGSGIDQKVYEDIDTVASL